MFYDTCIFGLILLFSAQMQWHLFSTFPFDLSTSNLSNFTFTSSWTWSHFWDNGIYLHNFHLCVYLMHCFPFSDSVTLIYLFFVYYMIKRTTRSRLKWLFFSNGIDKYVTTMLQLITLAYKASCVFKRKVHWLIGPKAY